MNIARIDAVTSLVVNIEVVPDGWIAENADPDGPFLFVEYDDTNPAHIGLAWEPIGGFEKPIPVEVYTRAELVENGVDLTAVDLVTAEQLVAVEAAPTKGTR